MDAVEYLKARKRMLGEFCYKNNCGACKLFVCCDCETDKQIEQDIEIVEKWARENPVKTYKDVLLEKFPNADWFQCCVKDIFGKQHQICKDGICNNNDVLWNCWNREYKELS